MGIANYVLQDSTSALTPACYLGGSLCRPGRADRRSAGH
jgi:hypothetical protein